MQDPSAFALVGDFSGAATTGADLDSYNAANKLWTLAQAGVRHIEVEQPIFRLSRFASRTYNIPFSYAHVGKLLTTATMIDDSTAPSDFGFPINEIVAGFSDPIRADGLAVAYAWKKKKPRLNGSGGNKRRVDQEYVYGLWSTDLYGQPI